jgi:hypothetical protein
MACEYIFKERKGGLKAAAVKLRVGVLLNPVEVTFSILVRMLNLGRRQENANACGVNKKREVAVAGVYAI